MQKLLAFLFLLPVLSLRSQVASEELDPFMNQIDTLVFRLNRQTGEVATAKILRSAKDTSHMWIGEKVSFRFINDSVFEQRFFERFFDRRYYFVIRGKETFEYDLKHQQIFPEGKVTLKDSAGYTIRLTTSYYQNDTIVCYTRSHFDSLRHCRAIFSTVSDQPAIQYVYENYGDTLMIHETYKAADGFQRLVNHREYRRKTSPQTWIETYTIIWYEGDSDEPKTTSSKIITHLQYDAQRRLILVTVLYFENGQETYFDRRILEISYTN